MAPPRGGKLHAIAANLEIVRRRYGQEDGVQRDDAGEVVGMEQSEEEALKSGTRKGAIRGAEASVARKLKHVDSKEAKSRAVTKTDGVKREAVKGGGGVQDESIAGDSVASHMRGPDEEIPSYDPSPNPSPNPRQH